MTALSLTKTSTVTLNVPDDSVLLQSMGRLMAAHANLEMVQIMCLKIIDKITPEEAMKRYRKTGAWKIREKIDDAVKRSSMAKEKKHKVADFLHKSGCLSQQRNELIHRFWAKRGDGVWVTSPDEAAWIEGLPSVEVINDLTNRIIDHTGLLNACRLSGEIAEVHTAS